MNRKVIKCLDSGEIYQSISELGAKINVAFSTISRHLENGKPIQGNRYKVIEQSPAKSAKAKKVECVETGEVFDSISEAAQSNHVSPSSISNCLAGFSKTCNLFHWKYAK